MVEIIGIMLLVVVGYFLFPRRAKFKEIERQQAVRQSILKLQEKGRKYSL